MTPWIMVENQNLKLYCLASGHACDSVYVNIPGLRNLFAVTDLGEFFIHLGRSGRLFLCEQGAMSTVQNHRKTLGKESIDLMK